MSVPVGLPHSFQFADPQDQIATLDDYGAEPDYDAPEPYGEEEGVRVPYQQTLWEHD
jgi:hypothetical protein